MSFRPSNIATNKRSKQPRKHRGRQTSHTTKQATKSHDNQFYDPNDAFQHYDYPIQPNVLAFATNQLQFTQYQLAQQVYPQMAPPAPYPFQYQAQMGISNPNDVHTNQQNNAAPQLADHQFLSTCPATIAQPSPIVAYQDNSTVPLAGDMLPMQSQSDVYSFNSNRLAHYSAAAAAGGFNQGHPQINYSPNNSVSHVRQQQIQQRYHSTRPEQQVDEIFGPSTAQQSSRPRMATAFNQPQQQQFVSQTQYLTDQGSSYLQTQPQQAQAQLQQLPYSNEVVQNSSNTATHFQSNQSYTDILKNDENPSLINQSPLPNEKKDDLATLAASIDLELLNLKHRLDVIRSTTSYRN